jgi:predicted  nucleic acid-binding Zn-ribbon protein
MLEVIEKLLILQDRDRKIVRVREEISRVEPERRTLQTTAAGAQTALENARQRVKQVESDRKKLELDVEAKKSQIEKYSLQQFQTKKNDEYRALAKEIENCKAAIVTMEDQEIELMEQAEAAQKQAQAANAEAAAAKKATDGQLGQLIEREAGLRKELADLESNRGDLTKTIDGSTLVRYQRLFKNKGDHVVVGINHGVCGGCHMKIPMQSIVSCQGAQNIICCPNCSRILYYTRDMDLTEAD